MSTAALARVRAVVEAARRVTAAGSALRAALEQTSGLSPEGVRLALDEHLETAPSEAELSALVARMRPDRATPRCHVVLAANVCTAALRALACAVAVAPSVRVRPSRRDPALARALVEALAEAGGDVTLVDDLAAEPGDEVHLYGSDEALAALAARVPATARVRRFGSGLGVAWVGDTDLEAAAEGLARDVVAFDQRGCLSPRFALVASGRAERFAAALHEALSIWGERVPRGPLDAGDRAALAVQRRTWQAAGRWWEGPGHAVALDPAPCALTLLPAARVVLVAPWSGDEASALLAPWLRHLTAVGVAGDDAPLAAPRVCALGQMQRPPLDGPVDLR